jgi:hypothetical protein
MTSIPRSIFALVAVVAAQLLFQACGGGAAQPPRDAATSEAPPQDSAADATQVFDASDGGVAVDAAGYMLSTFAGGAEFFLRLPPSFSMFLPLSGEEVTREPPGFHTPTSDEYFSYEFLWWLTGTPDLSTAALREDLQIYYIGLCPSQTVTVTLDEPLAPSPGDAGAGVLVARRNGTLDAGTCFNAAVPPALVEVSTFTCPDHTAVLVLISPQPSTGQVWTDLRRIRDTFSCF